MGCQPGGHYAHMWAISDFVPVLSIGSHWFLPSSGGHLLNAIVSPRTRGPWRGPPPPSGSSLTSCSADYVSSDINYSQDDIVVSD